MSKELMTDHMISQESKKQAEFEKFIAYIHKHTYGTEVNKTTLHALVTATKVEVK